MVMWYLTLGFFHNSFLDLADGFHNSTQPPSATLGSAPILNATEPRSGLSWGPRARQVIPPFGTAPSFSSDVISVYKRAPPIKIFGLSLSNPVEPVMEGSAAITIGRSWSSLP